MARGIKVICTGSGNMIRVKELIEAIYINSVPVVLDVQDETLKVEPPPLAAKRELAPKQNFRKLQTGKEKRRKRRKNNRKK